MRRRLAAVAAAAAAICGAVGAQEDCAARGEDEQALLQVGEGARARARAARRLEAVEGLSSLDGSLQGKAPAPATAARIESEMEREEDDEYPEGFTTCKLSQSNCSLAGMSRDVSAIIYPGGSTRCLSSDAPEYFFQVIRGDPDKLVLQFQGGGACWSESTFKLGTCTKKAMPDSKGMFDRGQAANPFRDYTIVNILYCSGDMFVANQTNSWAGGEVQQVGLLNTEAVLAWTEANFPSVDSLVLSGSSAGSLGVQVYASMLLGRFAGKFGRAVVLADSFVGVAPPNMQQRLFEIYSFCETPMVRESVSLSGMCESGDLTIQEMFYDAIKAWPSVAFANINSKTDFVQILFYDLWTDIEDPKVANIEGIRYFVNVNDYLRWYNELPNYISYLLNGANHVFLEYNVLYTADPQGEMGRGLVAKPRLVDWISQLISGNAVNLQGSVCSGITYSRSFWSRYLAGVLYCDAGQMPKTINLSRRS